MFFPVAIFIFCQSLLLFSQYVVNDCAVFAGFCFADFYPESSCEGYTHQCIYSIVTSLDRAKLLSECDDDYLIVYALSHVPSHSRQVRDIHCSEFIIHLED